MSEFDVTTSAILVKLSIGQRGLTASSRKLARETADAHDADRKSFKTIVQLMVKDSTSKITSVVSDARSIVNRNTLPWDDAGYRLCPVNRYEALMGELAGLEEAFGYAVDSVLVNYDEMKADYQRRVKEVATEIPFPTLEKLRSGFRFELNEMPIANPDDVRLAHFSEEDMAALREKITGTMMARLIDSQQDILSRLLTLVGVVVTQCSKTEKGKVRFHDSMIENIEDAVKLLPSLNLTDDPSIAAMIARVEIELTTVDVEQIRTDLKYRAGVAKVATAIQSDLRKLVEG